MCSRRVGMICRLQRCLPIISPAARVCQASSRTLARPHRHRAATRMSSSMSSGADRPDPLIQYVVLREDLWTQLGWPLGSVVAQGCHAAVAAVWEARDDAETQAYCSPEAIDGMHKVEDGAMGIGGGD